MSESIDVLEDPRELGFPFSTWRPGQLETIVAIRDRLEKIPAVVLQAPTGVGKSAIAMGLDRAMRHGPLGGPTRIVVATKQLQDQYARDYPGAIVVKGRGNFPCPLSGGRVTAQHCDYEIRTGSPQKCPKYHECPYFQQRDRAREAPVTIFNYAYYLPAMNFGGGDKWLPSNLLVLDEAHTAEDHLMDFIAPKFDELDFENHGVDFPASREEGFEQLVSLKNVVDPKTVALEAAVKRARGSDDGLVYDVRYFVLLKEYEELRALHRKLELVTTKDTVNWLTVLASRNRIRTVEMKPLWVSEFSRYYFNHTAKTLLMSATICDHTTFSRALGVPAYDYIEMPSSFDRDRRPFVLDYAGNMSKRTQDENLPKLLEKIGAYCEATQDKGIVHGVNYEISSAVHDYLRSIGVNSMSHESAGSRSEVLETFVRTSSPAVLVSPSFEIGVDLPYDQVRWQFVCKVPYPSLGDEVVRKRMEADHRWYLAKTLQRLVQAYGRAMRAQDDWGATFFLDSEWERFWPRVRDMAPAFFREAIVRKALWDRASFERLRG